MAKVLLTYDIDKKHSEVKAALKKKGYKDRFQNDGKTVYLPNTTMMKAGITAAIARDDMKAVAKSEQVELIRCFACEYDGWAAIWGEPHGS